MSKHHRDFRCLNCLRYFSTEKKRESHQKVIQNKDFCNIVMPSEDIKYQNLINIKNLLKRQLLFMLILNV